MTRGARARLAGIGAILALAGTAACGLVIGLGDHEAYPSEGGVVDEASTSDRTTDAPGADAKDASSDTRSEGVGAEAGPGCEASVCGNACVDLQNDNANCGSCGLACDASSCYRGTCGGGGVTALTAGTEHACALLKAGDVWCWGADDQAQILGPGDAGSCPLGPCRLQPTRIGGLPNAVQISAGGNQTCAVDRDGGVWCWGSNQSAGLGHSPAGDPTCTTGDASVACNSQPAPVAGLPGPATAVTSGQTGFACALVSTGVYCWGDDTFAQLGPSGADAASPAPLFVTGGASAVSAGFAHVCALGAAALTCWGTNASGELGHASGVGDQICAGGVPCASSPHSITLGGVTRMHTGVHASCFEANGSAYCLGANDLGQLGQGNDVPTSNPTPTAATLATNLLAFDFGAQTACALTASGLLCWGNDETHQTTAATDDSCTGGVACALNGAPVALTDVVEVRASTYATFARTSDGGIWAWGNNGAAQLGHAPGSAGDVTGCDPSAFPGGTVCNAAPSPVLGLP